MLHTSSGYKLLSEEALVSKALASEASMEDKNNILTMITNYTHTKKTQISCPLDRLQKLKREYYLHVTFWKSEINTMSFCTQFYDIKRQNGNIFLYVRNLIDDFYTVDAPISGHQQFLDFCPLTRVSANWSFHK